MKMVVIADFCLDPFVDDSKNATPQKILENQNLTTATVKPWHVNITQKSDE